MYPVMGSQGRRKGMALCQLPDDLLIAGISERVEQQHQGCSANQGADRVEKHQISDAALGLGALRRVGYIA